MLMVCLCITTWNRFLVLIFMMRSFAPPMFNLLPLFSNELHPLYQHNEHHEGVTLLCCTVFCNCYTNTQRERLDLLGVGLTSMACRPSLKMFMQKQSSHHLRLSFVTFTNPEISFVSTVFKQAQFRMIMRREILC